MDFFWRIDPVARYEASRSVLAGARRRNRVYMLIDLDPIEPVVGAWEARTRGETHTTTGVETDREQPDSLIR